MAYLYILRLIDKTCYCGITQDIVKRFQQHQRGKSKSTKRKLPVTLIYLIEKPDMRSAREMEVKIKSQGVTRWYYRNNFLPGNIITTNPQA